MRSIPDRLAQKKGNPQRPNQGFLKDGADQGETKITKMALVLFTDSVRVNTLHKMLDQQFGAKAWDGMNRLWRAAPPSPGAPAPNKDQSQASPGVHACPRSMPAWRWEFHQEISNEQRLLESMGGWCG